VAKKPKQPNASGKPRHTVEVVAHRDPDGPTDFTVIIDGRPAGHGTVAGIGIGIGITIIDIDPGFGGVDAEWVRTLWEQTTDMSPHGAAAARAVIASYAKRNDITAPSDPS
jgi:hypothetical protein